MSLDILATALSCDNENLVELALEIKKIEIASSMSALLVFSEKNSNEIARKLNKKPNQIRKILSGDQNLTIKAILEFSLALNYDFDVVFHSQKDPKPKQPWHIKHEKNEIMEKNSFHTENFYNKKYPFKRNLDIEVKNNEMDFNNIDLQNKERDKNNTNIFETYEYK